MSLPTHDYTGRPLVLHPLLSTEDTFWACLAYRLYECESKTRIAQLRSKLLLHFGALVFGVRYESLDALLADSRTLRPDPHDARCYKHPAIQVWVNALCKQHKMTGDVRTADIGLLANAALQFIRLNAKPCRCTDRFTLLYLFASCFLYDVYLWDTRHNRMTVLQAYRPNTLIDTMTPPTRGKEEFFINLVYTGSEFQLLLPKRKEQAPHVPLPWMLEGRDTTRVPQKGATFQLVRCTHGQVFPVSFLTVAERLVHYCVVPDTCPSDVYRLIPANPRILHIQTPLYVFISRGLEKQDPCQCVAYVDKEGNPAAFLLNPAETRLVMAIETRDVEFAHRCLAEEMKLN